MRLTKIGLLINLVTLFPVFVVAQDSGQIQQLLQTDSVDMNTLSVYSADVRENIYRVSLHPEGVARLKDIQQKSNEAFKKAVLPYSKEDQQRIWNLTTYNDLIADLSTTKGKARRIENVLKKYPAEIHDDAYYFSSSHFDLIVSIDLVNKEYTKSYDVLMANYSTEEKKAFSALTQTPEAFNVLANNMHLTVLLGDSYRSSPEDLRKTMDSLNVINAEQAARDAENWKNEMKKNPQAEKEFKESAEQYANENQLTDNEKVNPEIVKKYVFVSYPYWCGYPWWYSYEHWYPYPLWYLRGYYYWNNSIVWVGPPYWYFVHWHFHSHPHFYSYPHITNVYLNNYYYGPRKGISSNSREVNTWTAKNLNSFPYDFNTNQDKRVDRLKEFGKLETDRDRFNSENPGKNLSREEYIKMHEAEYPELKKDRIIQNPGNPAVPELKGDDSRHIKNQDAIKDEKKTLDKPVKDINPVDKNSVIIPDRRPVSKPSDKPSIPPPVKQPRPFISQPDRKIDVKPKIESPRIHTPPPQDKVVDPGKRKK